MKHRRWAARGMAAIFFLLAAQGFAAGSGNAEAVRSSPAYQKFRVRPVSEFSKLLYLIDRFGDENLEIIYDGHHYSAQFASTVARWFLSRKYHSETTTEWITRWCSTTVPQGNLIWVRFGNGKYKRARDVLFQELDALNKVLAEDKGQLAASIAVVTPGVAPAHPREAEALSQTNPPPRLAS